MSIRGCKRATVQFITWLYATAAYNDFFVCLDKLIKFFFLVCLLSDFHSGEIKISIFLTDIIGYDRLKFS